MFLLETPRPKVTEAVVSDYTDIQFINGKFVCTKTETATLEYTEASLRAYLIDQQQRKVFNEAHNYPDLAAENQTEIDWVAAGLAKKV